MPQQWTAMDKASIMEDLVNAKSQEIMHTMILNYTSDRTEQLVMLTVAPVCVQLKQIDKQVIERKKDLIRALAERLAAGIVEQKSRICITIIEYAGGYISESHIRECLPSEYKNHTYAENARKRGRVVKFATAVVQQQEGLTGEGPDGSDDTPLRAVVASDEGLVHCIENPTGDLERHFFDRETIERAYRMLHKNPDAEMCYIDCDVDGNAQGLGIGVAE